MLALLLLFVMLALLGVLSLDGFRFGVLTCCVDLGSIWSESVDELKILGSDNEQY